MKSDLPELRDESGGDMTSTRYTPLSYGRGHLHVILHYLMVEEGVYDIYTLYSII